MLQIKEWALMSAMVILLSACGGSSSSSTELTTEEKAIELIIEYAENGGDKPTIQDYLDAGATGVNASNIDQINAIATTLTADDVDTKEDIQKLIDNLDSTGPVITIIGDNPMSIDVGSNYSESGATATDDVDGSVTVEITSTVDTNTVGVYVITYTATDSANNVATATRTINVTAITAPATDTTAPATDTSAPVITITGNNPLTIEVGSTYTEFGATVSDNVDTGLAATISGSVNSAIAGSYILTYTATDSSNNTSNTDRIVNVVDTTAPIITLTGDASITQEAGNTYTELGATATDNVDTGLSVTISGSVDTETIGEYTLTYSATDSSGNAAVAVTRTVTVTDSSIGDIISIHTKEHGYEPYFVSNYAKTLLKDINTQDQGSYSGNFTVMNDILFFRAEIYPYGTELWRSDGTDQGTRMVKDINEGFGGSSPDNMVVLNNTLYFSIRNSEGIGELYKSDGTESGTVLVKSFQEDDNDTNNNRIYDIFVSNEKIFINVDTQSYGRELWVSDGTTDGTVLLKDINSGSAGSNLGYFTVLNDKFYFLSNNGKEIWESDGTTDGTVESIDFNGTRILAFGEFDNQLYFSAKYDNSIGYELYVYDPNSSIITLLKDINSGSSSSYPNQFVVMNGTLYFEANSGDGSGNELYKSDGTSEGTELVIDVNGLSNDSNIGQLVASGDYLFFRARDNSGDYQFYKSDGTAGGTSVMTIEGETSVYTRELTVTGGQVYVSADSETYGSEIFIVDESNEYNFSLFQNVNTGNTEDGVNLNTTYVELNGYHYFRARSEEEGYELWRTDGTTDGTELFLSIYSGTRDGVGEDLIKVGNKFFFEGFDDTHGSELWVSDGTVIGTELVKNIRPGSSSPGINDRYMHVFNDKLYFRANDGSNGYELWESDGTEMGTTMLFDIRVGSGDSDPRLFANSDSALYFKARDAVGYNIYKYEGATLTELSNPFSDFYSIGVLDNDFYLTGLNSDGVIGVYKYNDVADSFALVTFTGDAFDVDNTEFKLFAKDNQMYLSVQNSDLTTSFYYVTRNSDGILNLSEIGIDNSNIDIFGGYINISQFLEGGGIVFTYYTEVTSDIIQEDMYRYKNGILTVIGTSYFDN